MEYVTVHGDRTVDLPTALEECEAFEPVTQEVTLHCCDSGHIGDCWTGIPLSDLVVAASMPAETTHVVANCRDGFKVCIDVVNALNAILAYRRDGVSLDRGGIRLVGPDIDSTRSAKGITAVHPVSLESDVDPSECEVLDPPDTAETDDSGGNDNL